MIAQPAWTRFHRSLFRTRAGALIAVLSIAFFVFSALLPTAIVRAQTVPLSSGCIALNGATYDGVYSGSFAGRQSFFANERISLTAAAPQTGLPTQIRFEINFATAQTAAYPGTLIYLVTANTTFTASWTLDNGTASWLVSCGTTGEPNPPTATPTATNTATSTPTNTPTNTPIPTATPTSTATNVPTATPTTVPAATTPVAETTVPTATPCVGQGADHFDHASDRGKERRCDRAPKTAKEKKNKHDR